MVRVKHIFFLLITFAMAILLPNDGRSFAWIKDKHSTNDGPILVAERKPYMGSEHHSILDLYADGRIVISDLDKQTKKVKTLEAKYDFKGDSLYITDKRNNRELSGYIKNDILTSAHFRERFLITHNEMNFTSTYDVSKHPGFAVFELIYEAKTFFPDGYLTYDITETDILAIEHILISNALKGKPKDNFYIQCTGAINRNNEKEVYVNCVSKREIYQDYKIKLLPQDDNGVSLKINLTTKAVFDIQHGYK